MVRTPERARRPRTFPRAYSPPLQLLPPGARNLPRVSHRAAQEIDNNGGVPDQTITDNMWDFVGKYSLLMNRGPDKRRSLASHGQSGTPYLMFDDKGAIRVPGNNLKRGPKAYEGYFKQDPEYIDSFKGTEDAKIFELDFYKTFTAGFQQLPANQQSFSYQNEQAELYKETWLSMMETSMSGPGWPKCTELMGNPVNMQAVLRTVLPDNETIRGANMFWPGVPVIGYFDDSAGFIFGK